MKQRNPKALPQRDRGKLPKWAQQELRRLEGNVEHYKKKLLECAGTGLDQSRVTLDVGVLENDVPVPERTTTKYQMGRWDSYDWFPYIETSLRFLHDNPVVIIRGSDAVVVEPTSSNSFYVRLRDR